MLFQWKHLPITFFLNATIFLSQSISSSKELSTTSPKRWRDFRRYNGREQPWPHQGNRWDTPQEDEWNFGSSTDNQCNKVVLSNIPDQPYGNSDQAYDIPSWTDVNFKDFNVSAYDVYEERCCQGKTYPNYPNGQYSCCGSSDYDTVREVCCDGRLHLRQLTYECCGENYINSDTEICCYDPTHGTVARPLPDGSAQTRETRLFSQCCGEEVYDTRSHVCFMVTSPYNEQANFTTIEKKYKHTGCCEGRAYDQDTNSCNETGKTYTFLSGPPCVFKQAYEKVQKRLRSRGRPYQWSQFPSNKNRNINLERCGDQLYDPSFQKCCGDQYHDKENNTVKIWNRIQDGSCCGTEIYSYSTQSCCNGRIIGKRKDYYGWQECCGQALYDNRIQWCCEGSNTVVEAKRNLGESCCGVEGIVFNTSTHVCCNNRLNKLPDGEYGNWNRKWKCCTSNQPDQIYNSYSQKCCNGVVHNFSTYSGWNYECCGSEMYDKSISTCCGGKIYNQTSCCANKEAYDSNTHKCCEGTVVEKPSVYADSCCGKISFDHQLQTCCFDQQSNTWQATYKKSRYERCCGGKPYDTDKQSCCGSSIIIEDKKKSLCCGVHNQKTGNYTYAVVERKPNPIVSHCCGLSVYDRNSEICCNGNVIPDENKNVTCCGSNSYNEKSQLCCYGEVYDRSDDGNKKCCGKNVYDVTKEICCHGVPLPAEDINTSMCCYESLYRKIKVT